MKRSLALLIDRSALLMPIVTGSLLQAETMTPRDRSDIVVDSSTATVHFADVVFHTLIIRYSKADHDAL